MKSKQRAVISKKGINLAFKENAVNPAAVALSLLGIALLAALVAKFGVIDQYARVTAAENELSGLKAYLTGLEEACQDYDAVEEEYDRYTYRDFDRTLADRLDVLSLLEREVFPVCTVQAMDVSNRQLFLILGGLSLEKTSALIARLEDDTLVDGVNVSTYTVGEADNEVSVTRMTITLADATEGGNG